VSDFSIGGDGRIRGKEMVDLSGDVWDEKQRRLLCDGGENSSKISYSHPSLGRIPTVRLHRDDNNNGRLQEMSAFRNSATMPLFYFCDWSVTLVSSYLTPFSSANSLSRYEDTRLDMPTEPCRQSP